MVVVASPAYSLLSLILMFLCCILEPRPTASHRPNKEGSLYVPSLSLCRWRYTTTPFLANVRRCYLGKRLKISFCEKRNIHHRLRHTKRYGQNWLWTMGQRGQSHGHQTIPYCPPVWGWEKSAHTHKIYYKSHPFVPIIPSPFVPYNAS